ncbi:hypothetical protein [Streptomyces sp. SID13031]|uniref:hypothetical protein n=1 Tax=Streptomyces sp. SID13031 TaxID=2706046 RepID=UPI0013C617D0|nr:hypothetical protein [Streptomyces sp. SID13031]NEA35079.1 hypothetical protein [Streptomyces sp. SID13031]
MAEPLQSVSGGLSAVPLVTPVTRVSASHISIVPYPFKPQTASGWETGVPAPTHSSTASSSRRLSASGRS